MEADHPEVRRGPGRGGPTAGGPSGVSRPRRLVVALAASAAAAALIVAGVVVVRVDQSLNARRPGWTLLLQDRFDDGRLDPAVWNVQDAPSPRNNELQHYTPAAVAVGQDGLRITSDRIPVGDRAFSSGAIDTYGRFSFTYGRVEVRARLPEMGQGIWPAVWMLGDGCNPLGQPCPWPTAGSGEIDILEAVNTPGTVYTNLHYGTTVGTSLSAGPGRTDAAGLGTGFHEYAVEWEPGGVVRWYLDGRLLDQRSAPGHFDRPMYLLVNTAVGGDWPGPPDALTPFPQHFAVEEVRVYQRG